MNHQYVMADGGLKLGLVQYAVLAIRDQTEADGVLTPTPLAGGAPLCQTMELACYTVVQPLEPYLVQVQLAAWHSGWAPEEMAVHLALEGDPPDPP